MFPRRTERKALRHHISNLHGPIWKIQAEMEAVQSRDRPPRRPSLSIYQPPPGANGPQTAVSPGSSEAPGVARRVWWSSIPANVRPTRPQFIRHLPSPSALENCSESSPLLLLFFFFLSFSSSFSREAVREANAASKFEGCGKGVSEAAVVPSRRKRVIMLMNAGRA